MLHSLLVFSHSLRYPRSDWALLVLLPEWVGCAGPRPLWVSPTNSPVRLGVSPSAASTPTGVFIQGFEALFPHTGILGCAVCRQVNQLLPHRPAAALPTPLHNPPPHWVCQLPPCPGFSPPGFRSPPLLLVWINVSPLPPWLSDFHTVQFSLSSGCFLCLNCCCPSFGCSRRHSVSTYTSTLAGSLKTFTSFADIFVS